MISPNLAVHSDMQGQTRTLKDGSTKILTAKDKSGDSFTSSISKGNLSRKDFMKILLEELKYQDPTKPMDADKIMQSQLKMSSIESNLAMVSTMKDIQKVFKKENLATATSLINRRVEDGSKASKNKNNQYMVSSVSINDGDVLLSVKKVESYDPKTKSYTLSKDKTMIPFDKVTNIY